MLYKEEVLETRFSRFVRRISICFIASILLNCVLYLVADYIIISYCVAVILALPGAVFCYFLSAFGTLPTDDVALHEAGRIVICSLIITVLNIPYYTFITYGVWWLFDKVKAKKLH